MSKLTYQDICALYNFSLEINSFEKLELPFNLSYCLNKNHNKIELLHKQYEKKRQAIILEHVILDNEGNPEYNYEKNEKGEEVKHIVFKNENELQIKIDALLNEVVDIEFHVFDFNQEKLKDCVGNHIILSKIWNLLDLFQQIKLNGK